MLLALLAALAVVPLARADGDPASDYLLTRATFVPPDLGISTSDAARLATTVALARSRGYSIRVAVIGSAYDLGSVSSLDRKPKQYARFLGQELTLVYHGPLLIVMPNGFGIARQARRCRRASRSSTGCRRPARAVRNSCRPGSTACARSQPRRGCRCRRHSLLPVRTAGPARSSGASPAGELRSRSCSPSRAWSRSAAAARRDPSRPA